MARRLYLGKLPSDIRSDDIQQEFEKFGHVVDVRIMTGFGFVEFERSRDAEDAVRDLNGRSLLGANIVVEFAKETRGRRNDYDDRSFAPRRRSQGIRVLINNISRDTSWQDLKDFGREAGNVCFADIDRDIPGQGVLEYLTREDAEHAVKHLDNKELRGQAVQVSFPDDRGPDNFRRDESYRGDRERVRYDDHHRQDRHRGDRERGGRHGSEYRKRSESPPRRSERDRERSPQPPSREIDRKDSYYDGRRSGRGYDADRNGVWARS